MPIQDVDCLYLAKKFELDFFFFVHSQRQEVGCNGDKQYDGLC